MSTSSTKTLKKTGAKLYKKSYAKTYSKKYKSKYSTGNQVAKLTKQVRNLQKFASPEWLTCWIPRSAQFDTLSYATNYEITNENTRCIYLGPKFCGLQTADAAPSHELYQPRFLEMNITINNLGGLTQITDGKFDANGMWVGNYSQAGLNDQLAGNTIRIIICRFNQNTYTGFDGVNLTPLLGSALSYISSNVSGNLITDMVSGYYTEEAGGKKKDYHILYDRIIDMRAALGGQNQHAAPTSTFTYDGTSVTQYPPFPMGVQNLMVGEHHETIKLDLTDLGGSKVNSRNALSNTIDAYDYGMFGMWVFSNKVGPSSGAYVTTPKTWFFNASGRMNFTSH